MSTPIYYDFQHLAHKDYLMRKPKRYDAYSKDKHLSLSEGISKLLKYHSNPLYIKNLFVIKYAIVNHECEILEMISLSNFDPEKYLALL